MNVSILDDVLYFGNHPAMLQGHAIACPYDDIAVARRDMPWPHTNMIVINHFICEDVNDN